MANHTASTIRAVLCEGIQDGHHSHPQCPDGAGQQDGYGPQ